MRKTYRQILLDVDDTLLDFQAAEREGIRAVLTHQGIHPDEEKLALYHEINQSLWQAFERGEITRDEIMGNRFRSFFRRLGREVDGSELEKHYRAILDDSAVEIEGAGELLEYLSSRYELYVVSNGVSRTQHHRLAKSGFDRYLKDIFVSEDFGSQKPQKKFFDGCFRRMGDPPLEGMLVVGDSMTSDIRGGSLAGIDTCWFNRYGRPRQEEIEATYEIRRLEELRDIL